jgi:hypothetical protein
LYEPHTGLMTMIDGMQAGMVSALKSHPPSGKQAHATHPPTAGAAVLNRLDSAPCLGLPTRVCRRAA